MNKRRILFVCLGNICRSPMAEYVLRHQAAERGLSHLVETASAGTSGWHDGEGMHRGTRAELERQFGRRPGKQFKLTDLIPDSGYRAVPDPWYTGDFAETFRLVSAAAEALLDRLETAE